MSSFVAFLRGINVGGHRKIPMAELRAICPGSNVRSYIASGNLAFEADGQAAELANRLKSHIAERFGHDVPVLVLAADDLEEVLTSCPFDLRSGKLTHAYLCFEDPKLDKVGAAALRSTTEDLQVRARTVWLHAPDGIGRSKLAAKLEALVGVQVTARNLNTLLKMSELLGHSRC